MRCCNSIFLLTHLVIQNPDSNFKKNELQDSNKNNQSLRASINWFWVEAIENLLKINKDEYGMERK